MRVVVTSICLLACGYLSGCGSVGEPLYPALNIPSRVVDLTAVERGDQIAVTFTIPPLTTEGMAVKAIGSIELRVGPNPDANGFHADRWAAAATRVDIPAPAGPGAVTAGAPVRNWIGKEVLVAVRIGNDKGRMSEWSNVVTRSIQQPLETPAGLRAMATPEGVRLEWKAPNESKFRVYRRAQEEQKPSELATVEAPEYVDTTSEYGKTYEYFVQGLSGEVESEVATLAAPVTPRDTFPPAPPANVTASSGVNTIEVGWERNTERDFKEYRVYRSTGDGPFVQEAEGLAGPSYSDRKLEAGQRYRYRITAVDQTGNESPPSAIVEAVAP